MIDFVSWHCSDEQNPNSFSVIFPFLESDRFQEVESGNHLVETRQVNFDAFTLSIQCL